MLSKNTVAYCSLAIQGVDMLFKLLQDNNPFQTANILFVIISCMLGFRLICFVQFSQFIPVVYAINFGVYFNQSVTALLK